MLVFDHDEFSDSTHATETKVSERLRPSIREFAQLKIYSTGDNNGQSIFDDCSPQYKAMQTRQNRIIIVANADWSKLDATPKFIRQYFKDTGNSTELASGLEADTWAWCAGADGNIFENGDDIEQMLIKCARESMEMRWPLQQLMPQPSEGAPEQQVVLTDNASQSIRLCLDLQRLFDNEEETDDHDRVLCGRYLAELEATKGVHVQPDKTRILMETLESMLRPGMIPMQWDDD